jgi:hypothetical protein
METILKKEDQKKKIIVEEIDNGDPTMRIILGAVYEKKNSDNNREWLTVDGFTPYDSEGRYLGNEEFPIYHAIVTYYSAFRHKDDEGKTTTTIIERPNLRLAVDYIANEFKKIGVNLTK